MTDGARAEAGGARCRVDVGADGGYEWRLIAQNGRVVAVSAGTEDTYARCLAEFGEVCARAGQLSGGVQHAPGGNGWIWVLRDADGRSVAASARSYERYSTCRAACERFRLLLGELGGVTGSCP
ncbi:hypothetical protein FKN01_10155 [Streptomyces sp. 130]|uniref:hypothetical protein n=1 Tax=Streptomyces sp. 130 TaxID=2591006 RepID=UPI001180186C|nr:hypothetical protein [Streptomyces sp. 130]TRV79504.1 hypothetical protein FKN01_10155 [Streptomyces sp. 130]